MCEDVHPHAATINTIFDILKPPDKKPSPITKNKRKFLLCAWKSIEKFTAKKNPPFLSKCWKYDFDRRAAGDLSSHIYLSPEINTLSIGAYSNDCVNGNDGDESTSLRQVGGDIDGEVADDQSRAGTMTISM